MSTDMPDKKPKHYQSIDPAFLSTITASLTMVAQVENMLNIFSPNIIEKRFLDNYCPLLFIWKGV